jgi:hypothetical protein
MRKYHGKRNPGVDSEPGPVTVSGGDGYVLGLDPRNDLASHSDGLNWGYCGSGPAQLAIALLADATGYEELAQYFYQKFKNDVVSQLKDEWTLTSNDVIDWVAENLKGERV